MSATFATQSALPSLDVDLNGNYDALSDGLLVLRHLFGATGSASTNGALGAGAQRTNPADITAYLNAIAPALDVDGDGRVDALTDGVMVLRFQFGVRGEALTQGAISPGATRTAASEIEAFLQALMP
ncbi:MAG: hypothetical protein ABI831_23305 [Betaproteobacteria bacterium]